MIVLIKNQYRICRRGPREGAFLVGSAIKCMGSLLCCGSAHIDPYLTQE